MRILMLNHNLIGRGSYLRCLPLARELVRLGLAVDLVTAADRPQAGWRRIEQDGVHIHLPPRWGKTGSHDGGYAPLDILARIPFALRKWDLIHAFEHRPNVSLPTLISRLRGVPLVTDWSDWWTKGGITTPRRRSARIDRWEGTLIEEGTKKISDRVTVVSQCLWDRARSIGVPEDRLALIPSGCPHDRVRPQDKLSCRQRLGLPSEVKIAVFAGFAFWDFAFLVKAFHKVLEEFPDALLLVVGQDKDSEIEGVAEKVLGDRSNQVRFAGRFSPEELELPLGASDVQLLPLEDNFANRARWPIKFGDYLASGRPTVAAKVGDCAPILEREQAGLATEAEPAAFGDGILRLFQSPEICDAMGRRGRELAVGELSWEAQAGKMEALYRECIAERSR